MNTAQNTTIQIPEGFMQNPFGHLVPVELVKEIDKTRDALVREIVDNAKQVAALMAAFKVQAMGDIAAFVALSAERFDTNIGGQKGNITLRSFDGRLKVQIAIAETLVFDERLQIAKKLIDDFVNTWAEGTNDKARALLNFAFQVNKEGRVDTKRILSLRILNFDDPIWRKAMEAIAESLTVSGSKAYIRIYQRGADGQYNQVNLDLAAL